MIVGLVGCGSSGFHSATHTYSVDQIKAVFAAHGVTLQKVERHPPGTVELTASVGNPPFPTDVYIAPSVRAAKRSPWSRTLRQAGNSPAPISFQRHGNIVLMQAQWVVPAPVQAALADLH